ncbi:MAG: hypothetical protein U9R48_00985 [Chloroflexota bacterium]|nr:hypothetical protein [Chloroflexota bacterium]
MNKIRLGFVPSHRYPFDEDWAVDMRERCLEAMRAIDCLEVVVPSVGLIHNGLVRDDAGAEATIDLFAQRGVEGVVIGTMTFGDEISAITIAEALDVPVLVFGTKEGPFTEDGLRRSDSFCGTLSVTSGLYRHKIPYRFMGLMWPEEDGFAASLETFARACSAVGGFYGARVGRVGQRPERFETCTMNEMALSEHFGQRVVQIPLSEALARAEKWPADDYRVRAILKEIQRQADCTGCSEEALQKAAALELALTGYFEERDLDVMALSCWTEVQERYGICPYSTLSRLTDKGMMVACEADVYGALTMWVQYLAALKEAMPVSFHWTIKHQQLENVFLAWHCGNAPVSLASSQGTPVIREQGIMSQVVGPERAQGAIEFQLKPGPVTICRLVEYDGAFKMLITNGEIMHTDDLIRGAWAWVRVPDLARLYRVLAEEGFVHSASMIHGDIADAVESFCHFAGIEAVRV